MAACSFWGAAMPRDISLIVIHCSATPNGKSLHLANLDAWHAERGFRRGAVARLRFNPSLRAIGYHLVIGVDGSVRTGRHVDEVGAHAQGHNQNSIGLCLVGTDAYTIKQWTALAAEVRTLMTRYPKARLVGHRDLSPDRNGDGVIMPNEFVKTCPGFDVTAWLARDRVPTARQVMGALA